jgi:DNA-directed RNA polymerase specialized sigma24 family protein
MSIDVWLFDQLNRQLEELRMPESPISLAVSDPSVTVDDPVDDDLGDVHSWMERLLEKPQTLTLEEMVPDRQWDDFWNSLSAQEQRDQLARLLQELPKHQRQALMLKDASGFETFEIVRAFGRLTEDVESDLKAARENVRSGLAQAIV